MRAGGLSGIGCWCTPHIFREIYYVMIREIDFEIKPENTKSLCEQRGVSVKACRRVDEMSVLVVDFL